MHVVDIEKLFTNIANKIFCDIPIFQIDVDESYPWCHDKECCRWCYYVGKKYPDFLLVICMHEFINENILQQGVWSKEIKKAATIIHGSSTWFTFKAFKIKKDFWKIFSTTLAFLGLYSMISTEIIRLMFSGKLMKSCKCHTPDDIVHKHKIFCSSLKTVNTTVSVYKHEVTRQHVYNFSRLNKNLDNKVIHQICWIY